MIDGLRTGETPGATQSRQAPSGATDAIPGAFDGVQDSMPPDITPAGYLCPACGYAAGGLRGYVCPECAHPVTDEAIVAWRARLEMAAAWRALMLGHIGFGALIAVVYGAGARLLLDTDAALLALACCAALYGGSIVLGLGCAALMAPAHRLAAAATWLRELWLLHLPWLVVAPAAVIALVVAALERFLGLGDGQLTIVLAIFGLAAWATVLFVAPVVWASRMSDGAHRAALRLGPVAGAFACAGLVVLVAAAALGLAGGGAAVMGALELVFGASLE